MWGRSERGFQHRLSNRRQPLSPPHSFSDGKRDCSPTYRDGSAGKRSVSVTVPFETVGNRQNWQTLSASVDDYVQAF